MVSAMWSSVKESDVAGHIQLNKGERSKLAELAAKLL